MARSKKGKGGKKEFNNDNRGALFINDKDGNPARPDFRGTIQLRIPVEECLQNDDGTVTIARYVSGWEEHSDKCGTYLSLSVGEPDRKVHGDPEDV